MGYRHIVQSLVWKVKIFCKGFSVLDSSNPYGLLHFGSTKSFSLRRHVDVPYVDAKDSQRHFSKLVGPIFSGFAKIRETLQLRYSPYLIFAGNAVIIEYTKDRLYYSLLELNQISTRYKFKISDEKIIRQLRRSHEKYYGKTKMLLK